MNQGGLVNNNILTINPLPISGFATITYSVESNQGSLSLVVKDLLGKSIKWIETEGTNSSINVDLNDLSNGVYFVSLVLDGEVLQSKKIVISK